MGTKIRGNSRHVAKNRKIHKATEITETFEIKECFWMKTRSSARWPSRKGVNNYPFLLPFTNSPDNDFGIFGTALRNSLFSS